MKIIKVNEPQEISPGFYLEILLNGADPNKVEIGGVSMRYLITSAPHKFKDNKTCISCHSDLADLLVVDKKNIWRAEVSDTEDVLFLGDCGVIDKPHNDHKLFKILDDFEFFQNRFPGEMTVANFLNEFLKE